MAQRLEYVSGPKSYSLKEFFAGFRSQLPLLVRVEQGYCGEIGINTIDREEIFRIHTFSVQRRVVAVPEVGQCEWLGGKSLSIPLKYPIFFDVKRKEKNLSLEEVVNRYPLPVHVTLSSQNARKSVTIDGGVRSLQQVGMRMKLVRTYEDTYFLANPVFDKLMMAKVIAIPVFLPGVQLSVITDVHGKHSLTNILKSMAAYVDQHVTFDTTVGNEDIAVFSPENTTDKDANYTYLTPSSYYVNFNDLVHGRGSRRDQGVYSVLQPAHEQDNVYDVISADRPPVPPVAPKPKNYRPTARDGDKASSESEPSADNDLASIRHDTMAEDDDVGASCPPPLPARAEQVSQEASEEDRVPSADDISRFTISDLALWMKRLRLHKYVSVFNSNMVDGSIAQELDAETLCKDFHMKKSEAIVFVKFVTEGHFPK